MPDQSRASSKRAKRDAEATTDSQDPSHQASSSDAAHDSDFSESDKTSIDVAGPTGGDDSTDADQRTGETPDADSATQDRQSSDADQLSDAELIDRHSPGVWRYLRMLGCDDAKADDLTQETFLRVLRKDTFVQNNEAATAGYLRRTAYNLLVSDHRKHRRVTTISDSSAIDEVWDRWTGKDVTGNVAVDALKECFSELSKRAQLALTMRFTSEATRIEIAEALGISDHGARNLMQRAKRTLRTCVEGRVNAHSETER